MALREGPDERQRSLWVMQPGAAPWEPVQPSDACSVRFAGSRSRPSPLRIVTQVRSRRAATVPARTPAQAQDTLGGFVIVGLPDSRAAAATRLAVSSTGSFEHLETHELIEAEDLNPLLEQAKDIISQHPGP